MRERIVPTVCEGVLGDDKITIRHSILLPAVSEARPQEAIGRSTTQGIFCVRGAIWWKVNLLVLARQLWPKWPKRGGRQTASIFLGAQRAIHRPMSSPT
jgi:hypothetical protein